MASTGASTGVDTLAVEFKKLTITALPDGHREILNRAIANVLSSPIAAATYAQIIDGIPISSVLRDTYGNRVYPRHPILEEHLELSKDALDRAGQLRDSFDANTLQFDSRVIFSYQAASPGSVAFNTRLIELVAVAVHQIAVWLFKQGSLRQKDDPLVSWRPPEEVRELYVDPYPSTLFRHPWYKYFDQYPEGIADGVGYWAENRIFGGVVLFDRRTDSPDVSSVYFHTDGKDVTYRIYRLLDDQKHQLLQFLLSEEPSCPLPIHGDSNNRIRVDPEEPISETCIYRDLWERRPLTLEDGDMRTRHVVDKFNYLTFKEWSLASRRGHLATHRLQDEYARNNPE